jgi:hypothetical protein
MDKAADEFLTNYLKELAEDNAAVFVGAGLSRAAGYVDWVGLLRAEFELAKKCDLFLIPIGASGAMSAKLWDEVFLNLTTLFPKNVAEVEPLLRAIGISTDDPMTLLQPLLDLVAVLAKD